MLLVLERGYGVQDSGAVGGEGAEDYAYHDGGGEGDDCGPVVDGDCEGREEARADGDRDADGGADEASGEREEDGFGEELHADFAAGGAERFADADLLDARLHVGEHGVHDADAGDDERDGRGENQDDGEHVGDAVHGAEDVGEGVGGVLAGGAVAAGDEGGDALGGGFDVAAVVHAEPDFFELVAAGEVARDFVGDEKGVIADFGGAEGVDAFYEDSDDGEGNAADGDGVADGVVVVAEELDGHGADDVGDVGVVGGVFVVEETAGFELEAADVSVLGTDAEEHGVFAGAVAHGDAVVELEHGRAVADAGDLLVDGIHVLAGHVVGCADVVGAHDDAAGVLHLDFVGAERGDGVECVLLAGEADGGDEHDGRGADDHAEHGEEKTGLAGAEAVKCKIDRFAEGDGGAGAAERVFEGVADGRHREDSVRVQYRRMEGLRPARFVLCLLDAALANKFWK